MWHKLGIISCYVYFQTVNKDIFLGLPSGNEFASNYMYSNVYLMDISTAIYKTDIVGIVTGFL